MRIELNSILIMDFLDSSSFIIKFNKIKLYALSGIYKGYNSLYSKYCEFLAL